MDLSRFRRLELIPGPTPIQEMSRLRRALGVRPHIFMKRDDLTGILLGGNKVRKLEYVLADALARECDVILTTGAVQSNHCALTAALASRLGLECHLFISGEPPAYKQGNLLLDDLAGARLHFGGASDMEAYAAELRQSGRRPYLVPVGASVPLGALGYVRAMAEVAEQQRHLGVQFRYAFLATGSGGTQAGMEIGVRLYMPGTAVHGVAISRPTAAQQRVGKVLHETYAFLGLPDPPPFEQLVIHDQYYLPGDGIPNAVSLAAIRLLCRTEQILTEPAYTAKALAGMMDLLQQGRLNDAEAVLFFHTGGIPALFAVADSF